MPRRCFYRHAKSATNATWSDGWQTDGMATFALNCSSLGVGTVWTRRSASVW